MNVHHLNFLNINQQSNCAFGLDDMRQLFLNEVMLQTDKQWTNDDDVEFRRLASLYQVAVESVVVNFDMKKAEGKKVSIFSGIKSR